MPDNVVIHIKHKALVAHHKLFLRHVACPRRCRRHGALLIIGCCLALWPHDRPRAANASGVCASSVQLKDQLGRRRRRRQAPGQALPGFAQSRRPHAHSHLYCLNDQSDLPNTPLQSSARVEVWALCAAAPAQFQNHVITPPFLQGCNYF
jgi:hypothetical protein